MTSKMRPIHPGEILREELDTIEMSANSFARRLSVPTNRITGILNGQRAITADTAIRLARFFGTTPEFWLNLQRDYDLNTELVNSGEQINHDVEPYSEAA